MKDRVTMDSNYEKTMILNREDIVDRPPLLLVDVVADSSYRRGRRHGFGLGILASWALIAVVALFIAMAGGV